MSVWLQTGPVSTEPLASTVAQVGEDSPQLVKVDWYMRHNCDDTAVKLLATALRNNTHVRSIDLRGNYCVGDEGATQLANALIMCAVQDVWLAGTDISTAQQI